MHTRCCSLYSISCEHDARPRASTINEMGLRHCKARSPMLVVKRAWPAAWIGLSRPTHVSPSVVQFLANRVQNERVRLTTKDGVSRVGRKQTAFYPVIVTRFAEVGDGWSFGTNKIRPSRFPCRQSTVCAHEEEPRNVVWCSAQPADCSPILRRAAISASGAGLPRMRARWVPDNRDLSGQIGSPAE